MGLRRAYQKKNDTIINSFLPSTCSVYLVQLVSAKLVARLLWRLAASASAMYRGTRRVSIVAKLPMRSVPVTVSVYPLHTGHGGLDSSTMINNPPRDRTGRLACPPNRLGCLLVKRGPLPAPPVVSSVLEFLRIELVVRGRIGRAIQCVLSIATRTYPFQTPC